MFWNYLKVAWRNLLRHPLYAAINVVGLGIAIAFCVLAFLYVRHEWTYDAFHENADRIYRVYVESRFGPQGDTPDPLGPALEEAFSDIRSVRIGRGASTVKDGDRSLRGSFYFADPAILEVFTFPLLKGDPATVLDDPYNVVIAESTARRHFGDEDPLGKVLSVNLSGPPAAVRDFVVTGIAKSVPKNSSIRFDFLAPFSSRGHTRDWNISDVETYVMVSKNERTSELSERFSQWFRKSIPRGWEKSWTPRLASCHCWRCISIGVAGVRRAQEIRHSLIFFSVSSFSS